MFSLEKKNVFLLIRPHSCVSWATVRSLLQIQYVSALFWCPRASSLTINLYTIFLCALAKAKLIRSENMTSFIISADTSIPTSFPHYTQNNFCILSLKPHNVLHAWRATINILKCKIHSCTEWNVCTVIQFLMCHHLEEAHKCQTEY